MGLGGVMNRMDHLIRCKSRIPSRNAHRCCITSSPSGMLTKKFGEITGWDPSYEMLTEGTEPKQCVREDMIKWFFCVPLASIPGGPVPLIYRP